MCDFLSTSHYKSLLSVERKDADARIHILYIIQSDFSFNYRYISSNSDFLYCLNNEYLRTVIFLII